MEAGLVKKKRKQRLDSTHIVAYVKAMGWLECAMETLRLALKDLKTEVRKKKRPEFWERLWECMYRANWIGGYARPSASNAFTFKTFR